MEAAAYLTGVPLARKTVRAMFMPRLRNMDTNRIRK